MQQPLILTWVITPLDGIQMHPKSAQSFSGKAGSPDFFQAKMMELTESLDYGQAYIDDLFCISMESFEDHLEKLEEVLKQLHDAGLKSTLIN